MVTCSLLKITVRKVSAVANSSVGPVSGLSGWLDHAPPAFEAFVRLQEQGVSFEDAYQRCLAEQGQEFLEACDFVKTHGALATTTWPSSRLFPREALPGSPASCWHWPSGPTTSAASWCPANPSADLTATAPLAPGSLLLFR